MQASCILEKTNWPKAAWAAERNETSPLQRCKQRRNAVGKANSNRDAASRGVLRNETRPMQASCILEKTNRSNAAWAVEPPSRHQTAKLTKRNLPRTAAKQRPYGRKKTKALSKAYNSPRRQAISSKSFKRLMHSPVIEHETPGVLPTKSLQPSVLAKLVVTGNQRNLQGKIESPIGVLLAKWIKNDGSVCANDRKFLP